MAKEADFRTIEKLIRAARRCLDSSAGTTGALAAGYNTVMNALASVGIEEFDMPATPPHLW